MTYILSLHPMYLGQNIHNTIKVKLHEDVEGKYFNQIGYVLMVKDIETDVGMGLIDPSTGFAEFRVKYKAIVYCPINEEVTYCIVKNVTPVCHAGL
jgi:DNA-directed RNA polymerase II subunit RPB7